MSVVIREVYQAIIDEYKDEVLFCPTSPSGWRSSAENFFAKWNFSYTWRALDGKHVACHCPSNSGFQYFNYKGFYSTILTALVDADYKFIWADVGGTGSASDAQICNSSDLKECVENGSLAFPELEPLPNCVNQVVLTFLLVTTLLP